MNPHAPISEYIFSYERVTMLKLYHGTFSCQGIKFTYKIKTQRYLFTIVILFDIIISRT